MAEKLNFFEKGIRPFLSGVVIAALILVSFVKSTSEGDWTVLINSSGSGLIAEYIRQDLKKNLYPTPGHDGQFSYVIARNPLPTAEIIKEFDNPGFRYRRILYSVLSGGFGYFNGVSAFYGLIIFQILSFGLAFYSYKKIMDFFSLRPVYLAFLVMNPGLILSMTLLASDTMALALSLSGLLLYLKKHIRLSIFIFSLALLTKESFALIPLSICVFEFLKSRNYKICLGYLLTFVPLLIWICCLRLYNLSGSSSAWGDIGLPFYGLYQSSQLWVNGLVEPVLTALTVFSLFVALGLILFKTDMLMSITQTTWLLLALVASSWIWEIGNNAARGFLFIWILNGIMLGMAIKRRKSDRGELDGV